MLKQIPIHSSIRERLGYDESVTDAEIYADWRDRTQLVCKPCWELKYCPYGTIVEDYPLLPTPRASAESHHELLLDCLKTGKLGDGRPLDRERRAWFRKMVKAFRPEDHPEVIPPIFLEVPCRVFGHICPVFFVAEPFTETKTMRTQSRSIRRDVMLKVVRRDGQICQKCHESVRDDEVEFDHVIPFSKGGTTTVENLKLVHRQCNRRKGTSLDELLTDNPLGHLRTIVKNSAKRRKKA